MKPGHLLLPAEGECRNAVYAAMMGWRVTAFDQSEAGKAKVKQLATHNHVCLEYDVCDFAHAVNPALSFDAVALIFAHFPPAVRPAFHRHIVAWLKSRGSLIVEAFSKQHSKHQQVNPSAGGPHQAELLYVQSDLINEFAGIHFAEAVETETQLNEGLYHAGTASVIRLFGTKEAA
jgi:hypothetical protein